MSVYLTNAIRVNKGNAEGWATVKWEDIRESYLQVHERSCGKDSVAYRKALDEVRSPGLQAQFEKYRAKAIAHTKKQLPGSSQETWKTESGLAVPNPRDCRKILHLSYGGWIADVVALNPDVKMDKRKADEVLAQFEARAKKGRNGVKLSKTEEGVLGSLRKEAKRYWQQDKVIERKMSEWWPK
ncbi:hypothetical protein UCDDS831_g08385 [Diplodia seriata]|uniref:Uncharacterized protein n=1 Tax=Diplodia seriata TaxID=420778 RepID=A0A0G2GAJ8_9PEZI|nr:hypothetical protein UCDDS831_g08385 [Diplodia seriata]